MSPCGILSVHKGAKLEIEGEMATSKRQFVCHYKEHSNLVSLKQGRSCLCCGAIPDSVRNWIVFVGFCNRHGNGIKYYVETGGQLSWA